jgi:thioesterase domain-containing protein
MPLFSRHAFDMGWSQVARGGVDLRLVPGAHHNIMRAPYVQELARQITECMDQAGRDRC